MKLLPGRESIVQEAIETCSLAQMAFASLGNLTTVPYLRHEVMEASARMLLEKLLSLAIKARFLDDQTGILKDYDRRLLTIGKYYENGALKDDEISIRLVLNKLIHNRTISVGTDALTCVIFPADASAPPESRKIPNGTHHRDLVIVTVEAQYRDKEWRFEIDLFQFLNELVRTLENEI
ncbi:hypothetical protein [Thiohalomonas denitrificans]|uniref:hypothetical protein n=1 Tax=Thiohalomonas denitrificans TaxID=415747 RepID=UPI0026EE9EBD|nr:hypothetical protein [Thiohalomonas denitrificans]